MEQEGLGDQIEYTQFKGKWKEAVAFLQEVKHGIAAGSLYHPKIGEIDLVWGNFKEDNRVSSGYGLSKIIAKHPEVIANMQSIILNMKAEYINQKIGYKLVGYGFKGNVRLLYNGETRRWLMTLFEKE